MGLKTDNSKKRPDPLDSIFTALDAADDAIMILKEGLHVDCNMTALRMFQQSRKVMKNAPLGSLSPLRQPNGHLSEAVLAHRVQLALQGEHQQFEWVCKRSDGSIFHSETFLNRLEVAGEPHVLAIVHDMTDQKQTEKSLQETEERFRLLSQDFEALVDGVPDPLLLISPDLTIIWANTATAGALEMKPSSIPGRHCYELWHRRGSPCKKCPVQTCFITGKHELLNVQTPDGKRLELRAVPVKDETGNVIKVIEIARDLTHQFNLENQLRHSQKMDAVGHLAGGVAHDFNNVLTAIIGYASLLTMKLQEDDPLRKYAEHILCSSEKAAGLTQSLLAFSRKQVLSPRPVDLNEVIRKVQKLLLRLLREDIELKVSLYPEPLVVMAESIQLEQVLMNLMSNARDAMSDGGVVSITTDVVCMDYKFTDSHGYGRPGTYARISVTDTGHGMNQETTEKIFEPFFTTKDKGKSTGLGLATAYGIVKQHEGYINVYSEIGHGTSFKIYLPLMTQSLPLSEKAQPGPFPPGGEETILLAEDDEQIRRSNREILENFGYKIIEATDGKDAITKFRTFGDQINILILDVIMPKKSGKEVYDVVKEINPDIKVLFTSGYTADIITEKGIVQQNLHFIPKPVSPRKLLAKVREVLQGKE